MNLNEEVQSLKALQAEVDARVKAVLDALKDKSLSLDDRWTTFLSLDQNGIKMPMNNYGDGFVDHLDDNATMYDDFYVDRYATITYADMYERIMESDDEKLMKNVDSWRELVLQSGFGGFTHDW